MRHVDHSIPELALVHWPNCLPTIRCCWTFPHCALLLTAAYSPFPSAPFPPPPSDPTHPTSLHSYYQVHVHSTTTRQHPRHHQYQLSQRYPVTMTPITPWSHNEGWQRRFTTHDGDRPLLPPQRPRVSTTHAWRWAPTIITTRTTTGDEHPLWSDLVDLQGACISLWGFIRSWRGPHLALMFCPGTERFRTPSWRLSTKTRDRVPTPPPPTHVSYHNHSPLP